jgi:hypothetical protein
MRHYEAYGEQLQLAVHQDTHDKPVPFPILRGRRTLN